MMFRHTLVRTWGLFTLLGALGLAAGPAQAQSSDADLPDGFEQIIPRGRIAAIDHPQFVPASKAKIAGYAWVLGVVIDGKARAFSLNLLNHHEVVNDRIGDTAYAAVW